MLITVNTDLFDRAVPLVLVLGNSHNFTPSLAYPVLSGTEQWRSTLGPDTIPVPVSENVYQYSFTVPASAGPFNYGEFLMIDEFSNVIAIGSLPVLRFKAPDGSTVTFNIYFDFSSGYAQSFANVNATTTGSTAMFFPTVDSLPSPAAGSTNLVAVQAPYNELDSLTATSAYSPKGTWWSFSNYTTVATGITTEPTSGAQQAVLDKLVAPLVVGSGAYVIQFMDQFGSVTTRSVSEVIQGEKKSTVIVAPLVNVIPAGTSYRLAAYVGMTSKVQQFWSEISVTASQINSIFANDFTTFLRNDGSVPMLGNLNMNGFLPVNLGTPESGTDGASLAWVNSATAIAGGVLTAVTQQVKALQAGTMPRDGSLPANDDMHLGGHRIANMEEGFAGQDAVNMDQLHRALPSGSVIIWVNSNAAIPKGWTEATGIAGAPTGCSYITKT